MVKMRSDRPLMIEGKVSTEFETSEQNAKELEARGLARRVEGEAEPGGRSEGQAGQERPAGDQDQRKQPAPQPQPAPEPEAARSQSAAESRKAARQDAERKGR